MIYQNNSRNTIVIELTSPEQVGWDEKGDKKICAYLNDLAEILNLKPIKEPKTHLSPKYGLSGWVPLERSAAIHFYAWDDRAPTFVSIDISSRDEFDIAKIMNHAQRFFKVENDEDIVCKVNNPKVKNLQMLREQGSRDGYKSVEKKWRNLDKTIHRQRLSIQAVLQSSLSASQVKQLLPELSSILNMKALSEPYVEDKTAWMHWETSGVVMHWEKKLMEIDIYTCKKFAIEDAIAFIKNKIDIQKYLYQEY